MTQVIEMIHREHFRGCAFGIASEAWLVSCTAPDALAVDWDRLDGDLSALLGRTMRVRSEMHCAPGLVFRAALFAVLASKAAGLPAFELPRLVPRRRQRRGQVVIAMPALPRDDAAGSDILRWSLKAVLRLAHDGSTATMAALRDEYAAQAAFLGQRKLPGTNTLHFLQAAHDAGIPAQFVARQFIQFGWGAYRTRAQSSIFDTTCSIAVSTARDKRACSAVLRAAGLPVPPHALAASEEEARKHAAALGYPVVVKPADLDGGVGVSAGIMNEQQLCEAWRSARQHGSPILVERHQPGRDYRLIVFDGHLVWAVERRPAGITGDGKQSLLELVAAENRDARRGYHANATLRPLVLDEEAVSMIGEQGFEERSIIPVGQFVPLRRAANLSSGGTPVAVTDSVHPDNRKLVENAVKALDLDIGGVDLIIPDIAVSWRQSGGAIIEVNAQPQLVAASQRHLYGQLLQSRVRGNGRLPIVLVLGDDVGALGQALVERALSMRLAGLGLISREGLSIGGAWLAPSSGDGFADGNAMLMNRDVTALIQLADIAAVRRNGLAFDRFDYLVICVEAVASPQPRNVSLPASLAMILPHCQTGVIAANAKVLDLVKPAVHGRSLSLEVIEPRAMLDRLVRLARQGLRRDLGGRAA